ncbi:MULTISPECIES: hypothetical protein [unclassified Streptomyces]|uniref:hypothetical protein n=1 Tax=unclassified Streptomyces TaxID=2593676 RepID=UPI0035D9B095
MDRLRGGRVEGAERRGRLREGRAEEDVELVERGADLPADLLRSAQCAADVGRGEGTAGLVEDAGERLDVVVGQGSAEPGEPRLDGRPEAPALLVGGARGEPARG